MVEPLELWQRLGHPSYRDWVLAAQKARRVAAAAKKAAAKATTPAVQRQPSPPPLPTPAPPPVPYREEEVEEEPFSKTYESTGARHPVAACSSGLAPSGICDRGHVLARRRDTGPAERHGCQRHCPMCKRRISRVEAFWSCSPCNWWACDECSNPLAVAAAAKEAGLSVEEWLACRVSGRECNPLTVAAERAEAEEAGLSVEECHWSPLGAGIPSRCSNSRWLPPPHGMALEAALEAAAAVVTAAAALLASSPWQPPSLLPPPRGAPSEQPAPNRGSSRGRACATAPA